MSDFIIPSVPYSAGSLTSKVGTSFFWGGYDRADQLPASATATAAFGASNNKSFFTLFYLPYPITVTRISIDVGAVSASASQFASVGIYSADGNGTKLIDSGTFNVSTGQATGVKSNTISAVSLQPNFYYFVETTNSTDATFVTVATPAIFGSFYNNGTSVRTGSGTATTNGALNSTLGSVSGATNLSFMLALFEP